MNGGVRGVVYASGGVLGGRIAGDAGHGRVKQTDTQRKDRDAAPRGRRATRPTTPFPLTAHAGTISFNYNLTPGDGWVARGGGCC